jgi:hypothetical protein
VFRASTGLLQTMLLRAIVLLAIVVLATPAQSQNAEQYSEDAVKAVFLYRFTGFIDWPPATASTPEFSIAVIASDGVSEALTRLLAGRSVKGKPARILAIQRIQDIGDACMVYSASSRPEDLSAIAAVAAHRPILIVTSAEHSLERGATINFVVVDRHVRFEVSLPAANQAALKISSELLAVAIRVLG